MRSYADLWPRVTSFRNLYGAFRRARRGKRARADVAAFEYDLEANLLGLQRELLDETYRPGGYRNFVVHEPAERKISAAPFRERGCEFTGRCAPDKLTSPDRVVHHALCQVIEPLFERTFLPHSFANRVGKGTDLAMDRCQALLRRHPYVLKADVSKFFPSAYVRYVDDFLLFGESKPALHEARRRIEDFLAALRLTLHPRKTRVFPVAAGVPFLGFVHTPRGTRLKRDAVTRFARRVRRHRRALAVGALSPARLDVSVRSWIAHASYGQTYRLRATLFPRLGLSAS